MLSPAPIKNPAGERMLFTVRTLIAATVFLLAVGALGARLFYLQIERSQYFATRSNDNRMRVQPVAPVRGLIYDRNGRVLADNVPSYRLQVIPEQVPHMHAMLTDLASVVDLTPDEIKAFDKRLSHAPRFAPVALKFELNAAEVARFEVNRQRFAGVEIHAGLIRHYPDGKLTAHVVGYTGAINQADLRRVDPAHYRGVSEIGKVGVERSYEKILRGNPGSQFVEVNAEGRSLRELQNNASTPGRNIYLTLDIGLQRAAIEALGDQAGAVVVLSTITGGVLAMASTPSYQPQLFINGISHKNYRRLTHNPLHPLFNRVLRGRYPPGSTIKPMSAIAGLAIDNGRYIHRRYDGGYYKLPGVKRRWRGWNPYGLGWMNLHDAIMESSDIYFYDLAHDLGIQRLHDFLAKFGLGKPTGIDLPGERSGILPSPAWKRGHLGKPWYPGETLNTGIGQGYLSVTPLQLANAAAMIATRGHAIEPHVVRGLQGANGGGVKPAKPVPETPIVLKHPSDWERVISGMRAVVENQRHGTARRIAKGLTYSIAGKTGTAQVHGISRSKSQPREEDIPWKFRDHALFIAFAPIEHPRIAISVVVEHGGEGGAAAAPIARAVADAYFAGQHS